MLVTLLRSQHQAVAAAGVSIVRRPMCGAAATAACDGATKHATALALPPVVRKSFDPPADGFFLAGDLKVEHQLPPINFLQQRVLGIIPPPGEQVRTVVRHSKTPSGQVEWLRAFDHGKSFFSSTWTMADITTPVSEAIGGIHFAQHLELTQSESGDGRVTVTAHHHKSALLGALPMPTKLMQPHCVMDCHADGKGYDLTVTVSLVGLPMVKYTGGLRELKVSELNTPDTLSPAELSGLGIA